MSLHPSLAHLTGRRILLASASPRRQELLGMLDIPFIRPASIEVDETYPSTLQAHKVPEYLSRLKADAYRPSLTPADILITADTVVIVDDTVLGKPADEADARRMLHLLSDRTHRVITGVTIAETTKLHTFSVTTSVTFAKLTDDEIDYYVNHYHPTDKAGAYGIQEWIGAIGITGIDGSYYNVMGLPVRRVYEALKDFSKI
ncbi:MAG: Maf family nucleotide pyrophosphatase [Muribaculaceae bacterium]|nr:Maf family nucleotide pyrophosphatase [Muribaculaceae bacterium]